MKTEAKMCEKSMKKRERILDTSVDPPKIGFGVPPACPNAQKSVEVEPKGSKRPPVPGKPGWSLTAFLEEDIYAVHNIFNIYVFLCLVCFLGVTLAIILLFGTAAT